MVKRPTTTKPGRTFHINGTDKRHSSTFPEFVRDECSRKYKLRRKGVERLHALVCTCKSYRRRERQERIPMPNFIRAFGRVTGAFSDEGDVHNPRGGHHRKATNRENNRGLVEMYDPAAAAVFTRLVGVCFSAHALGYHDDQWPQSMRGRHANYSDPADQSELDALVDEVRKRSNAMAAGNGKGAAAAAAAAAAWSSSRPAIADCGSGVVEKGGSRRYLLPLAKGAMARRIDQAVSLVSFDALRHALFDHVDADGRATDFGCLRVAGRLDRRIYHPNKPAQMFAERFCFFCVD